MGKEIRDKPQSIRVEARFGHKISRFAVHLS